MGKRKRKNANKRGVENTRKKRRRLEQENIEELTIRACNEAPPLGVNVLTLDEKTAEEKGIIIPKKFEDLALTAETRKGLAENKFIALRQIQMASLPHSLAGRDVLGAARTGSGKTLCYVIPMLEILFREKWNVEDGLGAVVIGPTRELATQIFDVLRTVGKHHRFSAGLIMGGKNFKSESKRIHLMNILICTPGRLLQHMEETYGFHCYNVKLLILDEADRILDMGFQTQIESILENLPKTRQTLLFSATLSNSVTKLAKLSLNKPQYIKVQEEDAKATPKSLIESYLICKSKNKINFIWTFIRSHVKQKTIIFFTTRKQVRFVFEMFRKMQPGCPISHIHGKMVQPKRMATFYDFAERTDGAVLLSTQVAARGLDFPNVNWVVLFDCPSDVQTYVHSVGRTARNFANGNSLLLLLPSEIKFLERLQTKKIAPKKIIVKPDKLRKIDGTLTSFVAEDPEIKYLGERAFISYVRSLFFEKDKEVFQPGKIDFIALTKAMGLPGTPKIEGKNIGSRNKIKNMPYALQEMLGLTKTKKQDDKTYVDKLMSKKNTGAFSKRKTAMRELADSDEDEDDAFFTAIGEKPEFEEMKGDEKEEEKKFLEGLEVAKDGENFVETAKEMIKHADPFDKVDDRHRVREMHQNIRWEAKQKRREAAEAQRGGGATVVTLQPNEEEISSSSSGSESESDDDSENEEKQKISENSDDSDSSSDESESEDNDGDAKTMSLEQQALSLLSSN